MTEHLLRMAVESAKHAGPKVIPVTMNGVDYYVAFPTRKVHFRLQRLLGRRARGVPSVPRKAGRRKLFWR